MTTLHAMLKYNQTLPYSYTKTGGKSINLFAEYLVGKDRCIQHLETRSFWTEGTLDLEGISLFCQVIYLMPK